MSVLLQLWLVGLAAVSPLWPGVLGHSPLPTPSVEPAMVRLSTVSPQPKQVDGAVAPIIGARSALLLDVPSNTELYAKEADTVRPIASLAKLMTALLVTEALQTEQTVTAGPISTTDQESRLGLTAGEQFRTDDLLAAMMILSANDAAEVLAVQAAGSRQAFIDRMNQRARELGLANTRFDNPSGFDEGRSVSSVRDLARLSRVVLAEPRIREVVAQRERTITNAAGKPYTFSNTDELLGSYLPIAGLKTGTTDQAGFCLISVLRSGDRQLLAVALNSPDRFQENKSMLDWGLRAYRW